MFSAFASVHRCVHYFAFFRSDSIPLRTTATLGEAFLLTTNSMVGCQTAATAIKKRVEKGQRENQCGYS